MPKGLLSESILFRKASLEFAKNVKKYLHYWQNSYIIDKYLNFRRSDLCVGKKLEH